MQPRHLLTAALVVAVAIYVWMRRHAIVARFARSNPSDSPRHGAISTAPGIPPTRSPMVASVDGVCPETHPVKANPASHIYHLPHHRAYQRLSQPICFADVVSAEAEGYRASKQ